MTENATPTPGRHFISQIVAEDGRTGRFGGRRDHAFLRAQRLISTSATPMSICPELRTGPGLRRHLPPALRRHQSHQGERGIRRVDPGTTCAGWASTGAAHLYYASDYFEQLYEWAEELIRTRGKPTWTISSAEEMRELPRHAHRARARQPVPRPLGREENLDLFRRMRAGEFAGRRAALLRAKIDMASPNLNLRDPVDVPDPEACRITAPGTRWCIYPMYDWAHGLSRLDRGASPTPSARWSTRTTARSTTGISTPSGSITRSRSSSPGSISATP